MEEHNFVVGQEFPDVKSFRSSIKEAAIAQHFELRIIKSDLIRYIAKCAADSCPWRIRAVKLPNAPTFTIRSLDPTHTCGKTAHSGHHQASVDWIVNFIEERLRDNINYKPKDILRDIYEQYGITIPYKQAWRAKERGLQAIFGSSEEGYYLLPSYCEQIKKTNPGSVAEVFTSSSENRFHRLFVSFYGSVRGFLRGCLPIVCLGGIQLKSKYLGTLISATSFDADGGLYPIAFGVVEVESDENWMWFVSELHKAFDMNVDIMLPNLIFLSKWQNGIEDVVKRKFPTSRHYVCMKHLSESIVREFKNPRLVHVLWKAVYATTNIGFKEKMAELEEICPEAKGWLLQYPPSRWALIYSNGTRFGHLSSNAYDFNQWIIESRELPVIQVVEQIHMKLISEFEERRSKSKSWFSVLAPNAEKLMIDSMSRASTYQVLQSDEVEFEVISVDRSDIVNIRTHSCSCRDWLLYGLPCSHGVAALISSKKDVYAFTEKYFTVGSYYAAYDEIINPVPDKIEWKDGGSGLDNEIRVVRPPKVRRPPGRPEKKRMCVEDVNREKHTVHCSRCNQTGHYKSTCKSSVDTV